MTKRIKDTSKAQRLIDPREVAKFLGADLEVQSLKIDECKKRYFEFEILGVADGVKRIYELSSNEVQDYRVIIETEGQYFFHCVSIAGRHTENFWERIYGFRIDNPTKKTNRIRVIFYEKTTVG